MPNPIRGRIARGRATRGNLKLNRFQRAQRELNAQISSYAPIGLGRTAPARKELAKKILHKKNNRQHGTGTISPYFGTPESAANREMQRARSRTASQLLKRRKQLRKLGWKPKPRSP